MKSKSYKIDYWIEQVECSDIVIIADDIISAIHSCELWIKHNYIDCPFEIMGCKLV